MRSGSQRDEGGFTLMEVLIATVVAGILLVGVTSGFVAAINGTTGASDRFIESHDAQLLATYFPSDVQSALPSSVNQDPNLLACSGSLDGTTNELQLHWTEATTAASASGTAPPTAYWVSYRLYSQGSELRRYFCSSTSGMAITYQIVAHDLNNSPSFQPRVTGPAGTKIGLTVYTAQARSESAPYSYTFTASMRTPG
jgi:prepilin-type N-terminal cleavage/methylation domain-containing protein